MQAAPAYRTAWGCGGNLSAHKKYHLSSAALLKVAHGSARTVGILTASYPPPSSRCTKKLTFPERSTIGGAANNLAAVTLRPNGPFHARAEVPDRPAQKQSLCLSASRACWASPFDR